eukprot:4502990-Prymnesium_polylepis.1
MQACWKRALGVRGKRAYFTGGLQPVHRQVTLSVAFITLALAQELVRLSYKSQLLRPPAARPLQLYPKASSASSAGTMEFPRGDAKAESTTPSCDVQDFDSGSVCARCS